MQKGLETAFFTFSFADNHWPDLHRLMPKGLLEPKHRYRNTSANPHLADWYFSEKLNIFIKHFFAGVLDHDRIWHRYEWQSRTAIHAHGVVKLKNDPGIANLLTNTYAGRIMADNLANDEYIAGKSHDELNRCRQIVTDGVSAEFRVLSYVDTLLTAMNTRDEPVNPIHAAVPDPHPCSKDIISSINNENEMAADYEELANCVQRHVCRPQGYCKSQRGGTQYRFNYPFDNEDNSRIVFERIGETGSVRAKIVHKRNDKYLNVHNRVMLQH